MLSTASSKELMRINDWIGMRGRLLGVVRDLNSYNVTLQASRLMGSS